MATRTVKLASTAPQPSLQVAPDQRSPAPDRSRARHLDRALDRSDVDGYEDAIELWKIYGES